MGKFVNRVVLAICYKNVSVRSEGYVIEEMLAFGTRKELGDGASVRPEVEKRRMAGPLAGCPQSAVPPVIFQSKHTQQAVLAFLHKVTDVAIWSDLYYFLMKDAADV